MSSKDIVICGDRDVGKKTLMNKFSVRGEAAVDSPDRSLSLRCKGQTLNFNCIKSELTSNKLQNVKDVVVILVFNITNKDSINRLQKWLNEFNERKVLKTFIIGTHYNKLVKSDDGKIILLSKKKKFEI